MQQVILRTTHDVVLLKRKEIAPESTEDFLGLIDTYRKYEGYRKMLNMILDWD